MGWPALHFIGILSRARMGLQDLIKAGREADELLRRFEEDQEASRLAQRTNERRIAFIEHRLKRAIKTLDRRSSSETDWKYVVKAFQQFADWIEEQGRLPELKKLATESEALAQEIEDAKLISSCSSCGWGL
ncbi:hypothetical protein N8550_03070, partial [Pirellulaceae bacterium]|nr:hypothetical protein [Pirellulaceae bacterium]